MATVTVKRIKILIIATLLILNGVIAKKSRRSKRPKINVEETTPQPNVVTYSSFGFNDVSSYDGFVPSSPDYANYLSSLNLETTTRLYAPAFPTALDSENEQFFNNYDQPDQDGQNFEPINENNGAIQYHNNPFSFTSPQNNRDTSNTKILGQIVSQEIYEDQKSESSDPVYGTKISTKTTSKTLTNNNNNSYSLFGAASTNLNQDKYSDLNNADSFNIFDGKPNTNFQNIYNYAPTWPSSGIEDQIITKATPTSNSGLSYSKVIDFTNLKHPYAVQNQNQNQFKINTNIHDSKNSLTAQTYSYNNMMNDFMSKYKDSFNSSNVDQSVTKPKEYNYKQSYFNQLDYSNPEYSKNTDMYINYKDKYKTIHSTPNYNPDSTSWKNTFKPVSSSYQKYNNTFNFDYDKAKKLLQDPMADHYGSPTNNVVDFTTYHFPNTDYKDFKGMPYKKTPEYAKRPSTIDFTSNNFWNDQDGLEQTDHFDSPKPPKTSYNVPQTTSLWGNIFKPSSKRPNKKRLYENDDDTEEIVHIPKKLKRNKYSSGKHASKPTSQSPNYFKHFKVGEGRPLEEWNKEVSNRFKYEEDLLGLRNHDTSHPAYLPSFNFYGDVEDFQEYASKYDYKSAIDKWKQSYMKYRFPKGLDYREHENSPSESHPVHVPIPKPFPVEVPHPVIVPVPQPYPVRVPVPKPVVVPIVRELTVPVEKPVPYPVVKRVPYPIEKPVPVPVEKPVAVPVLKPYPVPIPHVRPVFHHSRPMRDEGDSTEYIDYETERDEEYGASRPHSDFRGGKRVVMRLKKPRSSRNRPHRNWQPSLQERNRRRWPTRKPSQPARGPSGPNGPSYKRPPQRMRPISYNMDEDDHHDHSDYFEHCRQRNNC